MWFDVGIKRYTTAVATEGAEGELWFDVGIKRYTTDIIDIFDSIRLWFDVGIKRYTTQGGNSRRVRGCGLM